jgi:hypothetical protein
VTSIFGFVDEPRRAVQQADGLISERVEKINQVLASERSSLENQWNQRIRRLGSKIIICDLPAPTKRPAALEMRY